MPAERQQVRISSVSLVDAIVPPPKNLRRHARSAGAAQSLAEADHLTGCLVV